MSTKRKWIYIIFLCSASFHLGAQTLEQTFQLAEQYQQSGNYEAAIETYLRVLFFDEKEQFAKMALLNTANLYYQTNDFKRAATYYQRSAIYFQPDTATLIFQQKVNALLSGHWYEQAKEELLYFDESDLNEVTKPIYQLQWATVHYGLRSYDESALYFSKLIEEDPAKMELLNTLIKKIKRKEKKSEALAFYMSSAIPGSGQIYGGDYRNGFNSLLLSGGLIAAGIAIGITSGIGDAVLIVAPWWIRYHLGGMYGADKSVQDYKVNNRNKIYQEILGVVWQ